MTDSKKDELDQVARIMGALVRMPPKRHDQMKIGKPRGKSSKSPAKRKPKMR
jgi:hypothetical protein